MAIKNTPYPDRVMLVFTDTNTLMVQVEKQTRDGHKSEIFYVPELSAATGKNLHDGSEFHYPLDFLQKLPGVLFSDDREVGTLSRVANVAYNTAVDPENGMISLSIIFKDGAPTPNFQILAGTIARDYNFQSNLGAVIRQRNLAKRGTEVRNGTPN